MILKVLFNLLTLLVLYGTTFCKGNDIVCTYDHDQVLNENGVEVSVTVRYALNTGDDDGYLNLNFHNGKFKDVPNIKAWCVDLDRRIGAKTYDVDVLSSMDANVTDVVYTDAVDKPEYLPSVNWLINEHPSGSTITIPGCVTDHYITDQEIQLSIWTLVDNNSDPNSYWVGETDQCVVEHLVNEGLSQTDYVPDCLDPNAIIGLFVIVDDEDNNILKQTLVSEVPLNETDVCDCTSGAFGDPHFRTWAGEFYDFHGLCDLTLIKNPDFENGLGMDIQIRSTRMGFWSYISKAAIRIGEDILEIVGGQTDKEYWINGVPGENVEKSNESNGMNLTSTLSADLSGYPIKYKKLSDKAREYTIELSKDEKIIFSIWNLFVGVYVKHPKDEHFQNSAGLMGSFPKGLKLARDNISIIDNFNDFGQEWQVLVSEPKLFRNIAGPQHPVMCDIPTNSEMRRRLDESTVTIKEAAKACELVKADLMDVCMFDVMATNDKSSAGAY